MENVIDLSSFCQFEFVGLAIYWVQNSKRPKKFCLQLLITFCFDIFAVQPNFLTKNINSRLRFFIVSSFLQFLIVLKVFSVCSHKFPKFFGQLISCFGCRTRVDVLFLEIAYVVTAVEFKRHVPYTGMFYVIISKFCHK